MNLTKSLRDVIIRTKRHILENSFENLIWLVDVVPRAAGFSIHRDKISAPFWIMHTILLIYIYGLGSLMYQIKVANGAEDFIKSYVSVSIFIMSGNNTYWFIMKRSLLRSLVKKIQLNDKLAQESVALHKKYENMIKKIKYILLIFYVANLSDTFIIYVPQRLNVDDTDYSMTRCVGMAPLTSFPNRQICMVTIFFQDLCLMTVVLTYQGLLLFLISHTAVMYQMLAMEMMTFNTYDDLDEHKAKVKERLPILIERHSLTLATIDNLKSLYSVPIGVNFGSNFISISLFFYLPVQEWVTFIPIVFYCFLVFFLYCFLCQGLINSSEVFERAVYSCGWENFNVNEKKLIFVMLRQAQKPVKLLAADIIPVNIYTFATTMRAIFKFVTMVKF